MYIYNNSGNFTPGNVAYKRSNLWYYSNCNLNPTPGYEHDCDYEISIILENDA